MQLLLFWRTFLMFFILLDRTGDTATWLLWKWRQEWYSERILSTGDSSRWGKKQHQNNWIVIWLRYSRRAVYPLLHSCCILLQHRVNIISLPSLFYFYPFISSFSFLPFHFFLFITSFSFLPFHYFLAIFSLICQMAGRSEDALEYERLALELMANSR